MKKNQEKGDLVRSIDYETVTSFDPPFVAAIKDLWNDPGIQVTFFEKKIKKIKKLI